MRVGIAVGDGVGRPIMDDEDVGSLAGAHPIDVLAIKVGAALPG